MLEYLRRIDFVEPEYNEEQCLPLLWGKFEFSVLLIFFYFFFELTEPYSFGSSVEIT